MAAIQINMAANSKGCGAQTLQNVQKTAAKHMSGMAAKKLRIIQAAGTSDQSAAVAAQRVEETLQEWQLSKLWLRIQKAADLKRCRENVQKTAAKHMSGMAAKKLRIIERLRLVYQSADSSRGHFGSISCNSGCTAGGGNTAGMAAIQINMAANSKGCGAQTLQGKCSKDSCKTHVRNGCKKAAHYSSRGHFGSISCSGCTACGGNTAGMAAI